MLTDSEPQASAGICILVEPLEKFENALRILRTEPDVLLYRDDPVFSLFPSGYYEHSAAD
jgi:hypothetical protein